MSMAAQFDSLRLPPSLAKLWQWWIAELHSAWNDLIDRLAGKLRSRWTLVLTEETCWVDEQRGRESVRHGEASMRGGPRHLTDDVRVLQWPQVMFERPIRIVLPRSWVLTKRLTLPRAVASRLHDTLDLQLDRHLPLPRDAIHWDVRSDSDDGRSSRLPVQIGIVKRSDVDALLGRLHEFRVQVKEIYGSTNDSPQFSFYTTRRFMPQSDSTARMNRRLAVAAAALASLLVAASIVSRHRERDALEAELSRAEPAATAIAALRDDAVKRADLIMAVDKLRGRTDLSRLLAELTIRLPADVWIQQLEQEGETARVRGLAPAGADVAQYLLPSSVLKSAAIRSAQSAGLGTAQDRFDLALTLRSREEP